MKRFISLFPLAAALALAGTGASAQMAAPAAAASSPATIGVTQQEAAEAKRKAVPRSDTGTLVRTSPSPANKASDALNGNTAGTASKGSARSPGTSDSGGKTARP
ncbi:MAG: hypothetical protein JWR68_3294 [Polaromonas sp.]|nr:hypothetical protein [Polaromonas sp.]